MSDERIEHVTFAPPKKAGYQPKYTPARVRKICDYVAMGLPYVHACAAVGIVPQTLDRWRKQKPEFAEALRSAEAEFMFYHLEVIDQSQDPQVSMKLLKARFPEHFSDGEKAVNVRMQVEGRIEHEAESLEQTLKRYAGAIEAVVGRETIDADFKCLPPGDSPEDDTGESVHPADADGETG